jgi:hypothetical protein
MIRLNIVAEGQTEEAFVNTILKQHLALFDVFASVRCIETSRSRHCNKVYRGGFIKYSNLKNDLGLWIKQDDNPEVRFTTMVDLYALPGDFPGYSLAQTSRDPYILVNELEKRMLDDIGAQRFIPYIQLHEYEALILAEPGKLSTFFLEHKKAIADLTNLVSKFKSPEEINQGEATAPSKQIISRIPEYEDLKVTVGASIADKIGLDTIRKKCPHFNEWLSTLEKLDAGQSKKTDRTI